MEDVYLCYNFSQVLLWNGVDSIKYLFIDRYLAVESIGLIVHKSPLVYNQCLRVLLDEKYMEFVFTLYNSYNAKVFWNLYFHIFENIAFNIGDVFQNIMQAQSNLVERKFRPFGKNIGHIVADLFYHNPNDKDHWTPEMSETVVKPGLTKKIKSEFYSSPEVMATNPTQSIAALIGKIA